MTFPLFIGIDQTGAAVRGGTAARPLPVCLLHRQGKLWRLRTLGQNGKRLRLSSFSPPALEKVLIDSGLSSENLKSAAIAIDCVLGLPELVEPMRAEGSAPFWQLLATMDREARYGRADAERYFAKWWRPDTIELRYPQRRCEIHARSNSVFQVRPYQKNIQTGTYRIWVDSARHPRWFHLWPFDENEREKLPWVFEGYPSFLWREVFGFRRREPAWLPTKLRELGIVVDNARALAADADLADAAVLAVGAWSLQKQRRLWEPFPGFRDIPERRREGWILGVTERQNR